MTDIPIQDPIPAISNLLKAGETLTVEFKSDVKGLSDRDLVAAIVAMVNTEGGMILLGVEDDGTVTGVQSIHQDITGLVALIANRTRPSVAVRAEIFDWGNKKILNIKAPKSRGIVSTSDGLLLRRRLMASGRPEAVPFYPHEFMQRQSDMGLVDPSAIPLTSLTQGLFKTGCCSCPHGRRRDDAIQSGRIYRRHHAQ